MQTMSRIPLLASALCFAASQAQADVTFGADLPLTGPAAGLGIPSKKGLDFWPDSIGGEKIKLIVLDNASELRAALRNALENSRGIVATQGVFRYAQQDHFGLDASARMMLTLANGNWKVVTP